MRPDRDRAGGFSLVEVLTTLAVSGAILAALASLVSLSVRQAGRVTADAQARDAVGRTLATLSHAIEGTARVRWAGTGRGFLFSGTRDRLVFAFDRREGDAVRTRIVRIESLPEAAGFALAWSEAAFTPDLQDVAQLRFGRARRLSTGPTPLRFAYVTAGTARLPEVLTDDWLAEDALPEAVRLALTDPASGAVRSSLRVPLRAAAEPVCLSPGKASCSRFDPRKAPRDDGPPGAPRPGPFPEQVQR